MDLLINSGVHGVILGAAYGIAGVTFGLLYRISRVFHFAFYAVGVLGAIVAAQVAGEAESLAPILFGVAVGMVVAGVATAVIFLFLYQPLRSHGATSGVAFIASLGLALVVEAVVAIVAGPESKSFPVAGFTHQSSILGVRVSGLLFASFMILLVVSGLASFFLASSKVGHQIRAIMSSREQAELVGINVGLLTGLCCFLAGAASVLAFTIQGMDSSVSFGGAIPLTLFAVLAMLLGGVESIAGTAIAGMGIGILEGVIADLVPGQWSSTAVFLIAILLILYAPNGLFTKRVAR